MFLVVSLATVLAVLVFAIGQEGSEGSAVFHPVYLVLAAGVALAFLTGDLFNLFVAFELMLIASYVLLTLGGRRDQVSNGMTYVVINLVASTLFITAVGFIYAATGTVNLAELSVRYPGLPEGLQIALGLVFVVVFGIKAAIFPLFFWLPDAYPAAPTSITAIFAGLLTKVGVYAMIRFTTLTALTELGGLLLVVAGLTMVVGVLGAIAQSDVKRILSFHIISQIGYMVMGLGLFSVTGLAGAILFIVHQIPVKTSLFLVGGLIEQREGTGVLTRVGGLVRTAPILAALFGLTALSLAGVPPFSGFVAKLALVEAGTGSGAYTIVAVSLVASVLTLLSMTKIWTGVFWGEPDDPVPDHEVASISQASRWLTTSATAAAVGLTLAIALAAGTLYEWSTVAAEQLLDPATYSTAVLGAAG
jgi:multicomponent Na+:H+ antiporter subunit D